MKKIYLLLACTLAYGYADAQVKIGSKMLSSEKVNVNKISSGKNTNSVIYQEKAATIWEDDFSDPNGRVDTLDNSTIVQGSGYTSATGLNTSGGTGTGLIVDIDVSELTYDLIINNAGTGYITGTGFTLTQIGGTGTGTGLTLDIVATDTFSLNDATLVPGTGYTSQNDVATTGGTGTGLLLDIEAAPIGGVDSLDMATLVNGTGYSDATEVATTGGSGSGLTVDIYTVAGEVDSIAVNAMGTGYLAGDEIDISGGNGDASIFIESITNGEITSVSVADAGDGNYLNGETIGINGGNTDATIDILEVNGGEITEVTITSTGDQNYQIGDIFTVDGGDNMAQIEITGENAGGEILDVMINESGANYTVGDVITIMAGDNSATIEVQSVYTTWEAEGPATDYANNGWSIGVNRGNSWAFQDGDMGTLGNFARFVNNNPTVPNHIEDGPFTLTYNKSIDLTDVPAPHLEFMHFGAMFFEKQEVQLYLDGAWVTVADNSDKEPLTAGGGEAYPRPEFRRFNLTSYLQGVADLTEIKIRLFWDADLNGGQPSYVSYGWFVDNLKIVEGFENDLKTSNPEFYMGDMSVWDPSLNLGVAYYMIPEGQVSDINFSGTASNNGSLAQNDAQLNVDVEKDGVYFESLQTPLFNLNPAETSDTLYTNTTSNLNGVGDYSFNYYASLNGIDDENTYDDTVTVDNIMVGGEVYARDNGVVSGGFTNVGGGAGNPFEIGNLFEFFGDYSMSTVQFYVSSGTDDNNDVGKLIYATILKFEDGGLVPIEISQDYEIKTEDRGTFVSLPLVDEDGNDRTVNAAAGEIYLVMVGHYGSDVTFSMAQSVNDISVLFRTPSGDEGLGYFADMNAVMLRVSTENFASISEAQKHLSFKVYPNPAGDMTNVEFELENASSVSFKLADMSGKTVYEVTEENTLSGKNTFTVPTKGLSNGVYFYSFKAGNKIINDKLIINK